MMGSNLINHIKNTILIIVLIGFNPVFAQSYDRFFQAIEFDQPEVVKALLQRGFDPNTPASDLQPALIAALQKGAVKVAQTLIAWPGTRVNGVNPNDESPLMLAALKGYTTLAGQLIERGADVNKTGWTPLHYAATSGHIEMIRLLLEHHAYIDAESPNGTTPLMMAAYYGGPQATKLLLEEGADPHVKNQKNMTALDFAYSGPHKEAYLYIQAFLRQIKQ